MGDTSEGIWDAYIAEVNYGGGGNAGARLAETSLVQGTDTLVAFDDTIAFIAPTPIPEREAQKGLGAGLYPNKMDTKMVPMGSGNRYCWLQTDDLYDLAISGAAINAIPTSFVWHTDNGIEELDHFGCVIPTLEIVHQVGKPSYQNAKIMSRSWKAGNAMDKVSYQSGAKTYMQNVSATIDSHTSANLNIQKIVQRIENVLEFGDIAYGLGDNKIQYPSLKARNVTLEIWYTERDSNTWAADERNETVQLIDATIVHASFLTSTMTNLNVIQTNIHENKHGIRQHYAKFYSGVGFTIA